jgi:hypothetical protein
MIEEPNEIFKEKNCHGKAMIAIQYSMHGGNQLLQQNLWDKLQFRCAYFKLHVQQKITKLFTRCDKVVPGLGATKSPSPSPPTRFRIFITRCCEIFDNFLTIF